MQSLFSLLCFVVAMYVDYNPIYVPSFVMTGKNSFAYIFNYLCQGVYVSPMSFCLLAGWLVGLSAGLHRSY